MNYPQIKPTLNLDFSNTKTLDPRINFRRGTPGAYYDGKTYAKAEENLISYSEDFSQWGFGRIVKTASQSAPDGSTDAYKIEQESGQTSSGYLLQSYNTSANKSYTFSVYAKAGTNRNYIILRTYLSNNRFTYFDLVNGEALNVDGRHAASISDAGNGWYRCSITYTPISSSSVQFNVYFSDNDSSITVADDGGFIYLWGAQLEQREYVTAYTPTTGTPVTKYQPQLMFASPDQPRFDHDPITGESKGLLIEESRTNLIEYSEDISAFPQQGNIILNKKFTIAPDGTSLANSIIRYNEPDNNIRPGQHIYQVFTVSSSDNVAISFYVKSINGANLVINNGACVTLFDLKDQTYTVLQNDNNNSFVSATITHAGNDWYKCTTISTGSGGPAQFQFSPWLSTTEKNWAERYVNGDNISGLYIWGIQVELGSFPTSYIKTSGASATRSADNASITGENFSSWYRQDEGGLYSEISSFDNRDSQARITLSDGTDNNRIFMAANIGSNILKVDGWGSSNIGDYDLNINDFEVNKIYKKSFGLKRNDYFISIDGQSEGGIASQDTPLPLVDRFDFSTRSTAHYVNGHIKKLSYYPRRLTNEQLQQLTK